MTKKVLLESECDDQRMTIIERIGEIASKRTSVMIKLIHGII